MATGAFLGALSGGAIGGATVLLGINDTGLKAGLAGAEAQTKGSTAAMGSSFSKLKAVGTVALAGLAVGAVKFAASAIAAAQEHEQAISQLTLAIKGDTTALEAQASALQMVTGFSDEAILNADTILSRYNLTTDQLMELNPLVLDFAHAQGIDAAAAAQTLGKALLGNARAIKAIGGEFEATGHTTQDLATLMGILQEKVGGVAEEFGKTSEGQAQILAQKFDELQEMVGTYLIPVLNGLVATLTWMLDNLPAIASFTAAFAAAWVAVNFAQVAASVAVLASKIVAVAVSMSAVAPLAAALGLVLYGLALRAKSAADNLAQVGDAAAFVISDFARSDELINFASSFALLREEAVRYGNEQEFLVAVQSQAASSFAAGSLTVEQYRTVLESTGKTLPKINRKVAEVSQGVNDLRVHFDKTGNKIANFAHLTGKELGDFREQTKEDFAVAGESVFGFKRRFEGTVTQFLRGLDNMRARAQETFKDFREFNKIHIGDSIRKFLIDQGPEAISAFVDANKKGRDKAVEDINGILDAQKNLGGQIDTATGKTNSLSGALGRLGSKNASPTITFAYKVSGGEALDQFLQLSKGSP